MRRWFLFGGTLWSRTHEIADRTRGCRPGSDTSSPVFPREDGLWHQNTRPARRE